MRTGAVSERTFSFNRRSLLVLLRNVFTTPDDIFIFWELLNNVVGAGKWRVVRKIQLGFLRGVKMQNLSS